MHETRYSNDWVFWSGKFTLVNVENRVGNENPL